MTTDRWNEKKIPRVKNFIISKKQSNEIYKNTVDFIQNPPSKNIREPDKKDGENLQCFFFPTKLEICGE